jgi:hypothetical protein
VSFVLQQPRLLAVTRNGEACVPLVEHCGELLPHGRHLRDAAVERVELLPCQRPHVAARRRPAVALAEDPLDLAEREADRERSPDEPHALDGRPRKAAVPVRAAHRRGQDAHALVVADRVRADAADPGQLAREDLVIHRLTT